MKILLLTRSLNVGGAERQVIASALGLKSLGHEVEIAVFYREGPLLSDAEQADIPVIWLGKRGRWDNVRTIYRLATRIRRFRPDVVYAFMSTANIVASIAKYLSPRTRTIWGVRIANVAWHEKGSVLGAIDRIEGLLSWTADAIICNSAAALVELKRKGWRSSSAYFLPNIIDTDNFQPRPEQRAIQRTSWNVPLDAFVIGTVARIDQLTKDYPTFLRAAAIASARNGALRFVCVGGGLAEHEREMKNLTASLGIADRVTWLGTRLDTAAIYCAFDALCSSSKAEGFSNSLAEGMACGLPAIATDVGDSADIVGNTGWMVPAEDPVAMANAFLACASGAKDRPSPRQRILDNYAPHNVLRSLEQRLREIANM